MAWIFSTASEYVACGVVVVAAMGFAWFTIDSPRDPPDPAGAKASDEPTLW